MDHKSLSVFDAATEPYGIREGINDGWLVPLEAFRVKAKSIDISNVRAVAGDLSEHDMALVVQQDSAVAEITQGVLEYYERRPTVLFAPDVKSATLLCNDLNSRAGWPVARVVTQETSNDARAIAFRTFGDDYLILVNVGVATEGVDLPRAEVIALARLTLSQALYIQMVGRGLRPLPGIDGADDRHAWIAASSKPRCLVLDFVGNVGKHSIASAAAMFGDKSIDEALMASIVAKVGRDINSSQRPISVLDAIEAEERSQLKKLAGEVESDKLRDKIEGKPHVTLSVELADVMGLAPEGDGPSRELATIGQIEQLITFGCQAAKDDGTPLTRAEASSAIALQRQARALASPKQVAFVEKHFKSLQLDAQALAMLTGKEAQKMIVKKLKAWGNAR
jgi:type I site-specific restriction endonuclease